MALSGDSLASVAETKDETKDPSGCEARLGPHCCGVRACSSYSEWLQKGRCEISCPNQIRISTRVAESSRHLPPCHPATLVHRDPILRITSAAIRRNLYKAAQQLNRGRPLDDQGPQPWLCVHIRLHRALTVDISCVNNRRGGQSRPPFLRGQDLLVSLSHVAARDARKSDRGTVADWIPDINAIPRSSIRQLSITEPSSESNRIESNMGCGRRATLRRVKGDLRSIAQ